MYIPWMYVQLIQIRCWQSQYTMQGRRRRGAGGDVPPTFKNVGGGAQVGLCPPPPPPLFGRANVLIETGRYHKPPKPKENRYCNYCKNIVEDECHFIYSCPLYNTLRMRFDPTLCNLGADKESNCAKLLNPDNVIQSRRLCEFLSECFTLRSESIK